MRNAGFATLPEAVEWTRAHWQGRELPLRIHEHAVEPDSILGSPRLAAKMMQYLLASPDDVVTHVETVACHHPRAVNGHCPDCVEGVKEAEVTRRRYPMWRALWRLSSCRPARTGYPKPIWIVLALWGAHWRPELVTIKDADGVYVAEDERQALILRALRSLAHEYEETAVLRAVPWTQKSDAQRHAEEMGAA